MQSTKEPSLSTTAFPTRLYNILEKAETDGYSSIVSWLPNGNGFKVHNRMAFETTVLPQHFTAVKYKSFQRQLHLYYFRRVKRGTEKGGYVHPFLRRGKPEFCHMIRRSRRQSSKRSTKLQMTTKCTMEGLRICKHVTTLKSMIKCEPTPLCSLEEVHSETLPSWQHTFDIQDTRETIDRKSVV